MQHFYKILINEHDPQDIELLLYQLKKSGLNCVFEIVQTKEGFEKALINFMPEIILSDYNLPRFDGITAFQIRQKLAPAIPFIFVSGTVGEENAVELIKNGATDFVLKERIFQIAPKVIRALNEARAREQKIIAEQQLRQREEQLQKILDLSLDIICTLDQDGRFVTVGAASKSVWGYLPEELWGKSVLNLIHEEDRESSSAVMAAMRNGIDCINYENRTICKTGKSVTMFWSGRWDPNEQLFYGIARDATNIKKAEEKIKNNEKRFRTLLQNSTDGLTLLAADGTVIERSPSALKILGFSANEVTGKLRYDLVHPDDVSFLKDACKHVKNNPNDILTIEYRFGKPDGGYKWLETTLHNQLQEPAVEAIVLNFRDITEKKLSELAIRKSEERYRSLFQFSPLPMWVYDVETLWFLNVNEAAIRQYGYSKEEFLGMTIKDIRPEEDVKELEENLHRMEKDRSYNRIVTRHTKKNGEVIYVEIQSNIMDLDRGNERLVLATDISERINYIKKIEAQNTRLREIAWIQSHVVRAPLARIMGLVDFINHSSKEEAYSSEILNHLMTSANELDEVIRAIISKTEQLEKI